MTTETNNESEHIFHLKKYCTQNDGVCEDCSLVNYGRDCMNNPIEEPEQDTRTPEPVEIIKLSENIFRFEMSRAESMIRFEMGRAESMECIGSGSVEAASYWSGYMRGLRRAYHGENFGTEQEHEKHLSIIGHSDPMRDARGRGYRAGLRGLPDAAVFDR